MQDPDKHWQVNNTLGECPIWDPRSQRLLWVDIQQSKFWSLDPETDAPLSYELPQRMGSFGLMSEQGTYIGAVEDGFAIFTPAQGRFDPIAPILKPHEHLRMNDGRVDRAGHFWAGSMEEIPPEPRQPKGKFMRLSPGADGKPEISDYFENTKIPNSLCWSADGKTLYFADSTKGCIMKTGYDAATGAVGSPQIFAGPYTTGAPDGSCIDAQDHLWNAVWGAGKIIRYRPDGTDALTLNLPVSQPTCVCIGGKNLDQLFVTTATDGLDTEALEAQPLAGTILRYDLGIKGRKENIYGMCQ
ncbi:SMP-30/gluconolactonase/LRE family protein [Litorimonas sp. RW-G-Af-16]|uniref:SMP-30/gluconolactonase/LRE family protein n=1 Tax=Litorimonas sp. RW-G-Af-16 TaxID=3241168 RepID=UPI00390C6BEB